jgi:hypothetical protein
MSEAKKQKLKKTVKPFCAFWDLPGQKLLVGLQKYMPAL